MPKRNKWSANVKPTMQFLADYNAHSAANRSRGNRRRYFVCVPFHWDKCNKAAIAWNILSACFQYIGQHLYIHNHAAGPAVTICLVTTHIFQLEAVCSLHVEKNELNLWWKYVPQCRLLKKVKTNDERQDGCLDSILHAVLNEQQEITSWGQEHIFTAGQESVVAQ